MKDYSSGPSVESLGRNQVPSPIRVLVVEDSVTMRRHIVDLLESDPGLQVVGEAADGSQAIRLGEELRPDIITMDMMLPRMSGLAATEYLMAHCPTPILIVSASTNRRELFQTYDALAAGAVDVLEKPAADVLAGNWRETLLSKVRLVARIPVITHVRGMRRSSPRPPIPAVQSVVVRRREKPPRLVAIGASTGGPAAILEILRHLPPGFDLPILFVLHLAGSFGAAFAEWLASQVNLPVSLAQDGMPLPCPGKATVLMAPPDHHLIVKGSRLHLTDDPERHSCRPSIDVLFESIAHEVCPEVIGCLLTGMGRDGAVGLYAIRKAGGITLVQDQATSVIFGMPAEAIRLGAAEGVLPLSRIAEAIGALACARGPGGGRP